MPKCKHQNVKLNIVIERWVNAIVADGAHYDHQITHDAPVALYVEADCADCGHHGQYNAYSATWCRALNRGGEQAGTRWPRWLAERLLPLRTANDAVQAACLACGVLPGRAAA